ncbi:hypothetical protein HHK36_006453 [Tetracentron sinense]|uniref:G-patch domain-containing protein n=1 Tax=Tetracentron sinense TaxID=13715 RepID=A0A835DKX6_TETSI|nr:hypothetical protein HHK36_006453 [Tetracentron sinense]
MAITKESKPPPVIGKAGRYTVFLTPPATPKPSETVAESPKIQSPKKIVPPPVQPPPQQFDKLSGVRSSPTSSMFGFFWNAVAKVQNAHSSLDEYLADWFGLNQSKYQWALNDYYESNGMVYTGNKKKESEASGTTATAYGQVAYAQPTSFRYPAPVTNPGFVQPFQASAPQQHQQQQYQNQGQGQNQGYQRRRYKVSDESVLKALKQSKKAEYSVLEQMNKMPAQISILGLLLSSQLHRKTLLKVLDEAQVPSTISPEDLEKVVGNITTLTTINFDEEELGPEGTNHAKALHITVLCNEMIVARVLIDNGSALNVCPRATIQSLGISEENIKPNGMTIRAFDSSKRQVVGEIDLEVTIGPHNFDITFQVVDIPAAFNLLLGRPWLHSAGAVPSSLHQRLKYIKDDEVITILAENMPSIRHQSDIPFIDLEYPKEVPGFHSFEFTSVNSIPRMRGLVEPEGIDVSAMITRIMTNQGYLKGKGLGRNLQGITTPLVPKTSPLRFGLGYQPTVEEQIEKSRVLRMAKLDGPQKGLGRIPHIRETFPYPSYVIRPESDSQPGGRVEFEVDEIFDLSLLFEEVTLNDSNSSAMFSTSGLQGTPQEEEQERCEQERCDVMVIGNQQNDGLEKSIRPLRANESLKNWETISRRCPANRGRKTGMAPESSLKWY